MVHPVRPFSGPSEGRPPSTSHPGLPGTQGNPAFSTLLANLAELLQGLFVAPSDPARIAEIPKDFAARASEKTAEKAEETSRERAEETPPPRSEGDEAPHVRTEEAVEEAASSAPIAVETPAARETPPPAPVAPEPAPPEAAPPPRQEAMVVEETAPPSLRARTVETRPPADVAPPAGESGPAAEAPPPRPVPPAPPAPPPAAPETDPGLRDPRVSVRIELAHTCGEIPPPPSAPAGAVEAPAAPPAIRLDGMVTQIAAVASEARPEGVPARADGEGRALPGAAGRDAAGLATAARASRGEAAPPDTDRVEFIERLMKAARMTMLKGQSRLKFVLNPPNLGSLKVDLSVREHVLRGTLRTETAAARDLIVSHLQSLRDQLEQQGIHVGALDVGVDQPSAHAGRQGPERAPSGSGPAAPDLHECVPAGERMRSSRIQIIDVMA
ncbi:MAG: flagellar hook-length control protein FliK [Planctomycetes bacterium]|nr:flagellar hook-length control protein FliK [Planctomycetota bacterium]